MTFSRTERSSSGSALELIAVSEIEAAQRLRYTVWRSEGVIIHHSEKEAIADYHDKHAIHWGFFDGNQLVGAARLCLHDELAEAPDAEMFLSVDIPSPVASMNRLVVLQGYRGQGIGRLLDQVRIRKAREMGARTVIATPVKAIAREQSLAELGFQALSGVTGRPNWSPTVEICAYYLNLNQPDPFNDV
jgi:GNAT superfamily N-acetyltransferase